jgi:hypothetical protein
MDVDDIKEDLETTDFLLPTDDYLRFTQEAVEFVRAQEAPRGKWLDVKVRLLLKDGMTSYISSCTIEEVNDATTEGQQRPPQGEGAPQGSQAG